MVDSSGLENRHSSLFRTIEGSNPSLSYCSLNRFVSLLVLPALVSERELTRLSHRAEPEKIDLNELKKRKEKGKLFQYDLIPIQYV